MGVRNPELASEVYLPRKAETGKRAGKFTQCPSGVLLLPEARSQPQRPYLSHPPRELPSVAPEGAKAPQTSKGSQALPAVLPSALPAAPASPKPRGPAKLRGPRENPQSPAGSGRRRAGGFPGGCRPAWHPPAPRAAHLRRPRRGPGAEDPGIGKGEAGRGGPAGIPLGRTRLNPGAAGCPGRPAPSDLRARLHLGPARLAGQRGTRREVLLQLRVRVLLAAVAAAGGAAPGHLEGRGPGVGVAHGAPSPRPCGWTERTRRGWGPGRRASGRASLRAAISGFGTEGSEATRGLGCAHWLERAAAAVRVQTSAEPAARASAIGGPSGLRPVPAPGGPRPRPPLSGGGRRSPAPADFIAQAAGLRAASWAERAWVGLRPGMPRGGPRARTGGLGSSLHPRIRPGAPQAGALGLCPPVPGYPSCLLAEAPTRTGSQIPS